VQTLRRSETWTSNVNKSTRRLATSSNGPRFAITRGTPSEAEIVSLDGQVLVIAFFAVALKLSLWCREEDLVVVEVEPDRKDVSHLISESHAGRR
jgi:hypothetical protein